MGQLIESAVRVDSRQPKRPAGADDISPGEYQALDRFRFLIRQFLKSSEEMAHAKGLTGRQHQLLMTLAGRAPDTEPTIGYIAERLMIKHHSAVGLVDRLASQRLVVREQSRTDRRAVLVQLTDDGIALLEELAASHREELRSLAPHLVTALASITADQRLDDGSVEIDRDSGSEVMGERGEKNR